MRNRLRKATKLPALLQITNIFGPSLNDSLTFKVPPTRVALNSDLLKQIPRMKTTAAHYHLAYLTANQVQSFHRMFLLNRLVQTHHTKFTNTNGSFGNPEDYQAYINPELVEGQGLEDAEETCLTYPFIKFIVPRYQNITLRFWDELKKQRQQDFTGYQAQLIQHCINHLNGELLMEYSLSQGRFFVDKDSAKHFPKTCFLLKQYSYRLKSYHSAPQKPPPEKVQQFQSMKADYLQRLKVEYEKESSALSQKLKNKQIDILP